MSSLDIPSKVPLILLPNQVLLPGISHRIESTSISYLMEIHMKKDQDCPLIVGVTSTSEKIKEPTEGSVATAASVSEVLSVTSPKKFVSLYCIGLTRIRIEKIHKDNDKLFATVSVIGDEIEPNQTEEVNKLMEELKAVLMRLFSSFSGAYHLSHLRWESAFKSVPNTQLVDMCSNFTSSFEEKLDLLQTVNFLDRLKKVIPITRRYVKDIGNPLALLYPGKRPLVRGVSFRIMDKDSKSLVGSGISEPKDLQELKEKLLKAKLPPHAKKVVTNELARIQKMMPINGEHSVLRNYLELIADLPWSISTSKDINIDEAKQTLDTDHYGLFKLKKRVLEYLAVSKLNNNKLRGPILCFVGPPGVGKTSVGRSIASILGRKFQRISLGGISHQSDIRGHRRAYIGSMPGRIIQAIKLAGTNNPVILLDEIDKMGASVSHGIPAAALLEVLDPEQNCAFVDHYLNIPFDLSKCIFIATANITSSIPSPLLDRMEIIELSGYTAEEKFEIAKNYLLPKQIEMHGLSPELLIVPNDTIKLLIHGYTKEAGVRAIERKLAAVCRAVAVHVVNPKTKETKIPLLIDADKILDVLGGSVYIEEDVLSRTGVPGVAVGLAYSSVGGSVLMVEATLLPSPGGIAAEILPQPNLILTGKVGEVMRESAQLALNWLRSVAHKYGLVEPGMDLLKHHGVHIHFPSGAISKEGPSAGVTIAVALMSLFTGIPVDSRMAFTGELTLQGVVLSVGGIREKIHAAKRAGVEKIVLPKQCINYVDEIPKKVLDSLELIYVRRMSEIVEAAFNGQVSETSTIDAVKCKL